VLRLGTVYTHLEDWMGVWPIHVHFGEERKRDFVIIGAELADLFLRARLCK